MKKNENDIHVFNNVNNAGFEKNAVLRFLDYKSNSYGDLDASDYMISIYTSLYKTAFNLDDAEAEKLIKSKFRGDTITSTITCFKLYLGFLYDEILKKICLI